jgi:hypothetical protein
MVCFKDKRIVSTLALRCYEFEPAQDGLLAR